MTGGDRDHRDVGDAVGGEQAPDVVDHRVTPVLGHGVDVVEHDHHHVGVRAHRREVAVVDGRVGVLLRVEDPHEHVGERDEPVHLEVVRHLGRVVVGEVEEHDALERVGLASGVEHRVTGRLVARRDAQPLQQLAGTLGAPDARGRPRRGGPAYADGRELQPGQRVERGRLARARGTGDPDDRVVRGEPQPAGAALDHRGGTPDQLVVEPTPGRLGRGAQALEPGSGVGAPGDQLLGPLQQGRHDPPTRSTLFVVLAHTLGGRCAQCSRWALEKRTSSTRRAATRSASGASSLRPRPSTRAV